MERQLNGKGEMDYDYANDVIFFKLKNREYSRSIEFNNITIDVDKEDFITGIQIFEASKFLRINKIALRSVPEWKFQATVKDKTIEIRLAFKVVYRNGNIMMNPIIMKDSDEKI